GAGATQRLPRLVGVPLAVEMICQGEPITAAKALQCGLIDEIASGELRAAAFAETLLRERRPLRRTRDLPVKEIPTDPGFFPKARAALEKRRRGVLAPLRCLAAVEAAATLPIDEGLALEQTFFAELMAGKIPDLPATTPVRKVARAAIIGAGTMGGGIAMCFANAGLPVTL